MKGVGWFAPALTALVVGGVSWATLAATSGRSPSALARPAVSTSSPAEQVEFADDHEVTVTFHRSEPHPVTLGRGGMVTQTWCVPGKPVTTGSPLVRLDDAVVYAVHQSVPLYRSLGPGLRGRDVESLQQELRRLGKKVEVTGRFGPATRRAVREMEKAAGVARPDGTLDLAEVVWLPRSAVTPAGCPLMIGQQASASTPVLTLSPTLSSVEIDAPPSNLLPGARTVSLFGVSTPLRSGNLLTDATFLAEVGRAPQFAQALKAEGDERPKATVALARPVTAYKVPPGALFGLSGTSGCVEVGDDPVPVTIVGSGLGASLVTAARQLEQVDLGASITATRCAAS